MTFEVLLVLYLFSALFAPLAFGAVEPWSIAVVEGGLFTACVLLHLGHRAAAVKILRPPGAVPLLLFLLVPLVQLLPLPQALLGFLSPATLKIYLATGLAEGGRFLPLSLNTKATLGEFLRYASCAAAYWLSLQLLADGLRRERAARIIAVFATCYALAAVMQAVLPGNVLLDFRGLPGNARPFGTYVNRSHFAALAGMLLPLLAASFLAEGERTAGGTVRARLAALLSSRHSGRRLAVGFGVVLLFAAVILSRSRGGLIAAVCGLAVLGAILRRRGGRGGWGAVAAAVLLAALFIGQAGIDPALERFGRLARDDGGINLLRPQKWRDTAALALDFPVAGTGLGSFADVYPRYRTIGGESVLRHAHNDYLELLATGGLPGLFCFLLFVLAVLTSVRRALSRRRSRRSVYLAAGALAGSSVFLLHGLFDFSLQIGANALWFFLLLGLAVTAAHGRGSGETELPQAPSAAKGRPAAAAAAGLLAGAVLFNGGIVVAGRTPAPERAALFDPLEADHRRRGAEEAWEAGDLDKALVRSGASVALAPTRGANLQRHGMLLAEAGREEDAERFIRLGVQREPRSAVRRDALASWLMSRGLVDEGLEEVRTAIELDPGGTGERITAMVIHGVDDERMGDAIPPLAGPLMHFGSYLAATGRHSLAEEAYGRALAADRKSARPDPGYVTRIAHYYSGRGLTGEALAVLEEGMTHFPAAVSLRLTAAAVHEHAGDRQLAAERYREALRLDPGSVAARGGLERNEPRLPAEPR